MTVLLCLLVIAIVGALAARAIPYKFDILQIFAALASLICGFAFVVACIAVPMNRMGCKDQLAQIEAVRNTRPTSLVQDAAWRMKAADANAQLASMKYWKHTAFGLWIPDEADAVEPLQ